MGKIREKLYDERLIGATFYRLLPYQVLMIAINAVNKHCGQPLCQQRH